MFVCVHVCVRTKLFLVNTALYSGSSMNKAFIFSKLPIVLGFLPVNQPLDNCLQCCVFCATVLNYENIPVNS